MTTKPNRIDFEEFAKDVPAVFERVRQSKEAVLVVRGYDVYRLEPAPTNPFADYDANQVREALHRSAGALQGVDREQLLRDIHAERGQGDEST